MAILLWIIGIFASLYGLLKLIGIYFEMVHRRYWKKIGVPYLTVDVTFLDTILDRKTLMDTQVMIIEKMKENNFQYAGKSDFGMHSFMVRDPELAKMMLVKDSDIWMDRRYFEAGKDDPIINKMLIFIEGQKWKDMRSLLSPNFTTGKIKRMFERIDECAQKLMNHLKNKSQIEEIDIQDTMSSFTMDVMASNFFGIDGHTIENRNSIFAKMGKKMQIQSFFGILRILVVFLFPKIARRFRISFFERESTDFFHNVVKNTIVQREQNGIKRADFLQLLIDYKNDPHIEKKVEIDNDVIGAQAVLFLIGGFETVDTLLSFSAYLLAVHPDLQEQMAQEVIKVISKHEGQITYEAVNELEFCERFINETLRLYPPATMIERRNNQDYKVPGTDIILPKNSIAGFPSYAIQRDEDNFPNPEKFDPDRWLKGEKDTINPYNFQPFGHGPRHCIGMRFALVEAKTILAHLVLNFKIEPTARLPIPLKTTLRSSNMKPKGDIYVKLTPRSN